MPGRPKKPLRGEREDLDPAAVLAKYRSWLRRQPLADRSREAYLAQVSSFVTWLAGSEHGGQALGEASVRDWAVRDYKRHVKKARRWAPASVNQALAAIDNFYRSLGAGRPEVAREELAQVAPRSLVEADQRRFLRAVQNCPFARDRAIATLFFYSGLRLAELAALDVADLSVSARRGRVQVRSGKGDAYRQVPLNSACRKALDEWGEERAEQLGAIAERTDRGPGTPCVRRAAEVSSPRAGEPKHRAGRSRLASRDLRPRRIRTVETGTPRPPGGGARRPGGPPAGMAPRRHLRRPRRRTMTTLAGCDWCRSSATGSARS